MAIADNQKRPTVVNIGTNNNVSTPSKKGESVNSPVLGTGVINLALTQKKVDILWKKEYFDAARLASSVFKVPLPSGVIEPEAPLEIAKKLTSKESNAFKTTFAQEITIGLSGGGTDNQSSSSSSSGSSGIKNISDFTNSVNKFQGKIDEYSQKMHDSIKDVFKPISSHTGQMLGTLSNMLKDPTGPESAIPKSIGSLIDRTNQSFHNAIDYVYKDLKVKDLMHIPSQVYGSLRNLASAVDAILRLPFAIAEDIYQGLMEIMQEIGKLLDSIISGLFKLLFDALDSLIPIKEIMSFISEVSSVMSMVGSITGSFSGLSQVTSMIQSGVGYISQAQSMLSNPQQLIMSYIPSEAGNILSFSSQLRNPQQLLNQLIPGNIMSQLQNIGNLPGLGFSGNLGYGLEGVFAAAKQGFLTNALNQFESQAGILKPLLGVAQNKTPKAYTPSIKSSPVNGIPNVNGVPVAQNPPKVLQEKNS